MKETKQRRAIITVPTIMRLSIIAFFIALPAAAYACVPLGESCDSSPCCQPYSCGTVTLNLNGASYGVCLTADLL
jgi:hypothetical protein